MAAMENPEQIRAMRSLAQEVQGAGDQPATLAVRWASLHDQATEIGRYAALAVEPITDELAGFPARIADAGPAIEGLTERGLDDILAMIEPGLSALRALSARGQEPTAPALALWREFHAARQALLALCPVQ